MARIPGLGRLVKISFLSFALGSPGFDLNARFHDVTSFGLRISSPIDFSLCLCPILFLLFQLINLKRLMRCSDVFQDLHQKTSTSHFLPFLHSLSGFPFKVGRELPVCIARSTIWR